jgi:FkbM family methyltransferase
MAMTNIVKFILHFIVQILSRLFDLIGYKIAFYNKKFIYKVNIKFNINDANIFNNIYEKILDANKNELRYIPDIIDCFSFNMLYKENLENINNVYNTLEDDISKETYFNIIKYRLTYKIERMEPILTPNVVLQEPKYPVPKLVGPDRKVCIQNIYFYSQYEIPGICEVSPGDIIFDIGGFIGDTALYFDSAIKPNGRVYSFEPDTDFIKYMRINIERNKRNNITIVNKGAFDKKIKINIEKNSEMILINDGCAINDTDINNIKMVEIELISIDEFIAEENINRIDYIKMDIEGAEKNAIIGSMNTITNLKPKLAISIYHKFNDLYELPLLIKSYQKNYKFYVRHSTYRLYESILFCV